MSKILDVVKTFGDEGVTAPEIATLAGFPVATVYNHEHLCKSNNIDIVRDEGKRVRRFVYNPEKKSVFRNAEGYTDKTAGEAISGKHESCKVRVGGVYSYKYLIIKAFSDMVVYLEALPLDKKPEFYNDMCVKFELGGETYYTNPHRIWSIPTDKINLSNMQRIDLSIFREISGLAGMSVVEVEKEVEKVVIQEKIVEKRVEDAEYKLAVQEAKIWKEAFYVANGKSVE